MRHIPKLRWEIDAAAECPCGSGLKYRKCCRPNAALAEKAQEFFNKEDFPAAERATRAELTRYIGWIYRHTIPTLGHPRGPFQPLIEIDINALENLAERLAIALEQQHKREGIVRTFDHIASFVPLPGLRERMTYLSCLWMIRVLHQTSRADELISQWTSHEKIQDLRLLQLYFERRSDVLSPVQQLALVGRILERTKSPTEKLQYFCTKAMLTILIGEQAEAERVLSEAMGAYFESVAASANEGNLDSCWTCAHALELQGVFTNDKTAFHRALAILEIIDLRRLNPKGVGDITYQMGRLNLLAGDDQKAISWFSESHACAPSALPIIYRLDAYVRAGELDKAKADLAALRGMVIPETWRLEFLRSASSYAVKAQDFAMAKTLAVELKDVDLEKMHFRSQRDELRAALLEFVAEQTTQATTEVKLGKFQKIIGRIRALSEYLELKPNFCGIGLNLNKALEPKSKAPK